MAIVCIEYPNTIKWESGAEIYNADTGRYITTISGGKDEVNAFLKRHFYGDELFPCDIRIDFNGTTDYKFTLKN